MDFYLGAFQPAWLGRINCPLFVSHLRLRERKTFPRAIAPWALDSGAFTQVANYGCFIDTPARYVEHINRYSNEVGQLQWAAPMDHMCEPFVLRRSAIANDVETAQCHTVANFLELQSYECAVPIIPVLQGYFISEYFTHMEMYAREGIDLTKVPLVGVGSVCRRQSTTEIVDLIRAIHDAGIAIHGFGVKMGGIGQYGSMLASADSMAWSYQARVSSGPCPISANINCANCLHYAYAWRMAVLARL